jgi:hypothetical protein
MFAIVAIFLVSLAILFFIQVHKVSRTNEFGVQQYKTASGAVVTNYLLFVLGNIARPVCGISFAILFAGLMFKLFR